MQMHKPMALNEKFKELVLIAIGEKEQFSCQIRKEDWKALYDCAQRQTLTGVLYAVIEKLPQEQRPPCEVLLPWYMQSEKIKEANKRLNKAALQLTRHFNDFGLQSVVLKGQGVAWLYPHPELRTPGDIDIWVNEDRQKLLRLMSRQAKVDGITYHHADYDWLPDVATEVHFTPSWMYSPRLNRRLQQFFVSQADAQFGHHTTLRAKDAVDEIGVPTTYFNSIYMLVHIFRHVMFEGIGLRQLMDYYYVLRQGLSEEEKRQACIWIKELHLLRFAGAVMYVLQQMFCLGEKYLLTAANIKDGQLLLKEIELSGNFGKYDERRKTNRDIRYWRTVRLLHFWSWCSEEVLCAVPFKVWHWGWRRKQIRNLRKSLDS